MVFKKNGFSEQVFKFGILITTVMLSLWKAAQIKVKAIKLSRSQRRKHTEKRDGCRILPANSTSTGMLSSKYEDNGTKTSI